jgi:hypothetical protein
LYKNELMNPFIIIDKLYLYKYMTYFIEFIKSPLNILIIILLLFSLFIVLGTYKEGFTSTEITGQTYTDVSGNIYINGTEITDTIFTGPNGNNAEIISVNGDYEIIVTDVSGNQTTYNFNMPTTSNTSSSSNSSSSSTLYNTTFYGQNGGTAQIITGPNGSNLIQITNTNGQITTFSPNNNPYSSYPPIYPPSYPPSYPPIYPPSYPPPSYPPTSYPPTSYPPTSYPPTSYPPPSYPPTNTSSPYSSYSEEYTSPYTQTSSPYTQSSPSTSYDYSNSLPPGIPMSQIPPGQEDLYILKSEIVPPVCPAPVPAVQSSTEQCAPCPPCARCPQPNFECKKVPNYSSSNNDLPSASMSPYSTFGS